jgi:hypothetical protein
MHGHTVSSNGANHAHNGRAAARDRLLQSGLHSIGPAVSVDLSAPSILESPQQHDYFGQVTSLLCGLTRLPRLTPAASIVDYPVHLRSFTPG